MKKLAMVLLVLVQIAALALLFTEYMRFGMFLIAFSGLSFSMSRIILAKRRNSKEAV